MKPVSSKDYFSILNRIDFFHKNGIKENVQPLVKGSELEYVIHRLVPYNPTKILREASRIAVEAGISGAENWSLTNEGASLCSFRDDINFFAKRRTDIHSNDSDKLVALEILALVCEHIHKNSQQ